MKVLLAGAAGYVGRYFTWKAEDRYDLRLSDVAPPNPDRLPWVYGALDVQRTPEFTPKPSARHDFSVGDLCDYDYCLKITKDVDVVLNLSGHVRHEEPVDCFRVNAVSTFNLLEAAVQNGVKTFLTASSINASGWFYCRYTNRKRDWPYFPVDEKYPTDHEDPYSLAKYCNELNCLAWTNRTGATTGAFRFSGVFPPEWTNIFASRVKPTEVWPEELHSYVDLRDVVDGLIKAVDAKDRLPKFGVYQMAAPDTQMPEPTMELLERFHPEWVSRVREPLPGRTSLLSHKAARDAFGFNPVHHWKEI